VIVRELQTLLSFRTNMRGADDFDNRLDGLKRAAAAAAAAIAAAFSIKEVIRAGDAYTTTMNRLGAATDGPEQAAKAYEALYSSARETGVAVDETSKAFMRFSPAMTKAGFSMDDTVGLIDGLQKGLLAAGANASETSAVFQQLGQAINSGVFQGEELGSFLENASPTLVTKFADALGTTSDKLKEMGSEGKLTTKNVLPALVAAAKAGRDEFGKMRPTVELSMARSRVAVDRFLAELERGMDFTRRLAEIIEAAGRKIDEWRRYIPGIRDLINEFGGLERILSAVALGAGYLGLVLLAFNGTLSATIARLALLTAQFTAVVAVGLLLQDFITWMQGGDTKTLFGEWFGPFDQAVAPIRPALEELKRQLLDVKAVFLGTPDEAQQAWERLKSYLKGFWNDIIADWPDWLKSAVGFKVDAPGSPPGGSNTPGVEPPSSGYIAPQMTLEQQRNAAAGVSERQAFVPQLAMATAQSAVTEDVKPIMDTIRDGFRDLLGSIGFRQRIDDADGKPRVLQPGENMVDALRRSAAPTTNNNTANQTNTVNNNIVVNATGVSGPEVASGASRGVGQAMDDFNLNADRLARSLRMALPGVGGAGGQLEVMP
jgi:tape measure domain-containing protein